MTEPFDEYGERLRRVLSTEAEAVAPSPEGLEQIRKKINRNRDRRFDLWYAAPWLRPLAAVSAAVFAALLAVSATPGLKTFVQTGHFSTDDSGGSGHAIPGSGLSHGQPVPSGSGPSDLSPSPHRSTITPTVSGTHVVKAATCPPGLVKVEPPAGAATPSPQAPITCQPEPQTTDPTTPVEDPTPPPTTPPQTTESDPPGDASQPVPVPEGSEGSMNNE
jgi:hypothetical protein